MEFLWSDTQGNGVVDTPKEGDLDLGVVGKSAKI